jgi:phosphate transport system permease protein
LAGTPHRPAGRGRDTDPRPPYPLAEGSVRAQAGASASGTGAAPSGDDLEVGPGIDPAGPAPARARAARPRRRRAIGEWLVEAFLHVNGFIAIAAILLIFIFLFKEGIGALWSIPFGHFFQTTELDFDDVLQVVRTWQPVGTNPKYSLLPGSLLVALPATILATLFGVACGVYLAEIAGHRTREWIKPGIELLAGVPSVVIGFFCLATLATLVQTVFHTTFRLNAFVGALGVTLVIVPVIASMTDDALRAVPSSLREGAHALGANRWETIARVVVPAGASGLIASILLGMGRALGETMIVLMATGNAAQVTANPFESVRTMTATIAAELGEVAHGSAHYQALFLVGTILFVITFAVNLVAEIAVARMRRRLAL